MSERPIFHPPREVECLVRPHHHRPRRRIDVLPRTPNHRHRNRKRNRSGHPTRWPCINNNLSIRTFRPVQRRRYVLYLPHTKCVFLSFFFFLGINQYPNLHYSYPLFVSSFFFLLALAPFSLLCVFGKTFHRTLQGGLERVVTQPTTTRTDRSAFPPPSHELVGRLDQVLSQQRYVCISLLYTTGRTENRIVQLYSA